MLNYVLGWRVNTVWCVLMGTGYICNPYNIIGTGPTCVTDATHAGAGTGACTSPCTNAWRRDTAGIMHQPMNLPGDVIRLALVLPDANTMPSSPVLKYESSTWATKRKETE